MVGSAVKRRLWGWWKTPGWLAVLFVTAWWLNNAVGIWANAEFLREKDWHWAGDLWHDYWTPIVLVGGLLWIAFVPNRQPREPATSPVDYVMHKGLRWRYQTFDTETATVNPYRFCPVHDVKLLWEAVDKERASWMRHDVSRGMWFSTEHNGKLVCVDGGEHEFVWPDEQGWMAGQASEEAAALLEKLHRSAQLSGAVVA